MSSERVVVMTGDLEGQEFPLLHPVTVGRNPDNTIFLDDRLVSRKHAVIESTAAGTILKDLGSGNGTFVGDRRVIEYSLTDGDVFKIGSVELKYEGKPGSSAAESSEAAETHIPGGEAGGSTVRFQASVEGAVQASSAENVFQTLFAAPQETASADQLKETQRRLTAIYEANQIISSEQNLKDLFRRMMEQIFNLVPANNGVILVFDEETGDLTPAYEKSGGGEDEIQVSSAIVQRASEKGEAVLVYDAASDDRFEASASIVTGNIASALCVPLKHQEEILGVLYVDTRGTTSAFTQGDLEMMVAVAGPSAIAIRNAQYVRQLEEDFQTTLKLLANAIELRDHYTLGHTWRVTNFALAIGERIGWDEEQLKTLEMGGVLHDVGKIAVEDAVLRKPGKLTKEEYEQMKIHPERGAALMKDCRKLEPLIPYCLYHHERYDGNGYPHGLKGEDIPIEGRIIAVADSFDAMTSNRPYRKGMDPQKAIEEIEKCKGTQFDPEVADAFIEVFNEGKINYILQVYNENEKKSIVCPFCSTYVKTPDDSKEGDMLSCGVCHRHLQLTLENGTYIGRLMTAADLEAVAAGKET